MHFNLTVAIVGVIFLLGGLALVFARKRWAAVIARRRQRFYPTEVRRVLGFQERPTYFLIVGLVFALLGALLTFGEFASLVRR